MAHQHGPQCRHGHGQEHGHGHSAMSLPGMQQPQQSPEQYFRNLSKKWSENRVFFWQELLQGVALDRAYERCGLDFMRSLSCQFLQMLVQSIQMMVTFEWIPFRLRPLVSGLFFPLAFLLFFNYNVVVGVGSPPDELLWSLSVATLLFYVLVALRGCSVLNSEQTKAKSKEAYGVRPYLQNPQMSCSGCGVVRLFRAAHCPFCKTCVAKHSRHSLVWGSCVGAANQLLALLFFLSLALALAKATHAFHLKASYGFITKLMFYLLNLSLSWMTANEALQLFMFNLVYGVTEQELKTWPMQQHLQKIPQREFYNNVDQGFCLNLQGSLMACFGLKGYESEQGWGHATKGFPVVDPKRNYRVNWAKAFVYLIPQLPFHKSRGQILQMMQREQPRMVEMFKLQQKFKEEVAAESAGQQLNEFQLQQKVALKMQAHMMRNMPQMQMGMPSPDQQRTIQLQMLGHMRRQFANEPELAGRLQQLIKKLQANALSPIEANMAMRQIQQELMKKRMEKVMKQAQEQQLVEKKQNEEEEAPMKPVSDEDL